MAGARLPLTDTGQPSVAADALNPRRNIPGLVSERLQQCLTTATATPCFTTFLEPYDALVRYCDGSRISASPLLLCFVPRSG